MLSGEIFQEAFALLEQGLHSGGQTAPTAGQVVMGTVEGDIHNIGKDMVVSVLTANGFQVHNLGEDVPPDLFVAKLKETSAPVLGLSGLITTSFDSMRSTVDALVQAGIRDGVKVMIGGAVVDEHVRAFVGADAWGRDPFQAVKLAQQLAGG
jgi:methanogenic corrinoid protein MtbC1